MCNNTLKHQKTVLSRLLFPDLLCGRRFQYQQH